MGITIILSLTWGHMLLQVKFHITINYTFDNQSKYTGSVLDIYIERDISAGVLTQIAKFMWPTWGPPGSCRPQVRPTLAQWTLLWGKALSSQRNQCWNIANFILGDSTVGCHNYNLQCPATTLGFQWISDLVQHIHWQWLMVLTSHFIAQYVRRVTRESKGGYFHLKYKKYRLLWAAIFVQASLGQTENFCGHNIYWHDICGHFKALRN